VIILMAIVIGVLYGTALFMMMRRSIVKILIGLAVLGQAGNLLVFTAGGLRKERGHTPLIAPDETSLMQPFQDPIPQALVLTAVVIGFGVMAFALTVFKQTYRATGTDDVRAMQDPAR
jgi:multicomponent Na+:H+ antiporter subunit C